MQLLLRWSATAFGLVLAGCVTPPETPAASSSVLASIPSPAAAASSLTVGASALAASRTATDTKIDVWIFDIGQGSCVIVDCPDGDRPLVVDCGSRGQSVNNVRSDTVERASALLATLGKPTVVISHGDEDHYSLIPSLVEPDNVDAVWIGGRKSDYGQKMPAWFAGVKTAGHSVNELSPQFFGEDDKDLHCGRAKIDILIANATRGATKNGDSIVLGLSLGDVTIVLPGDAEGPTERQALANKARIARLDNTHGVIIGSHHGANTNGSNGHDGSLWESSWNSIATIFSMTPSSYRHPQCEVVKRYAAHMPPLGTRYRFTCGTSGVTSMQVATRMLSTHDNGDLLVRLRPTRMTIHCQVPGPACNGAMPTGTYDE